MNLSQDNAPATQIIFASDARKRLWRGMSLAAEAVGCTLGPRGRTVLIQRPGQGPVATKDGVTVSRSIRLRDPVERMGAELVREAASQTNDVAGDGTTTATVLTAALVEQGLRLVETGLNPRAVCVGIERGASAIDAMLRAEAAPVSTTAAIAQVGTISANGDAEIGKLIAGAMERVGRDGIITVEDARGMSTTVDVAEGMQFERGYLSPYFVNDAERMRASYEAAYVLVVDRKLSSLKDLVPVLERVMQVQKPLLVIAEDVDGEALQGLVLNRIKGNAQWVAIKAPGYGPHRTELLNDICALTGASLVSAATGLTVDKVQLEHLGQCKKFVTDAKSTTIVGTGRTKDAVDKQVADLRTQLEDVTLSEEERTKLRTRVARLASGVAIIKVGGATEVEMSERKYRVEDALNATKAAVEEGVIPGGGTALATCGAALVNQSEVMTDPDEEAGRRALARACFAPMRRIVENAGVSFDLVNNELIHRRSVADDQTLGYNAATGVYECLVRAGVVDPCKVTRLALKNAVSVAVTFLSLDAVVFDDASMTEAQ